MKKTELSKENIYHFWHMVDNLLPDKFYTYGNNNSFEDFCERYNFLVNRIGDKIIIDDCVYESGILTRYFCIGVPKEIIKIFKKVALTLCGTTEKEEVCVKILKKVEKY